MIGCRRYANGQISATATWGHLKLRVIQEQFATAAAAPITNLTLVNRLVIPTVYRGRRILQPINHLMCVLKN
jgi:hypothetical protein